MQKLIMKYGVNKNTLLLFAGTLWVLAGFNVFRIGITLWYQKVEFDFQNIALAIFVFLIFFYFIFKQQFHKHTKRINSKSSVKYNPFSFFDLKGWLTMIFMICLGTSIRKWDLIPIQFISVFYTGLSLALILTGLLFIRNYWTNKSNI